MRRRVITLIGFAATGLLVNVLAMVVLDFLPLHQWGWWGRDGFVSLVPTHDGRWRLLDVEETLVRTTAWENDWGYDLMDRDEVREFREDSSDWVRPLPAVIPSNVDWSRQDAWAQGWPFRCAVGRVIRHPADGGPRYIDAITLLEDQNGLLLSSIWWRNEITLPLRPLWPGLLLNTTFYATLLALLWFTPRAINRTLRRRRGRCAKCNYNLRGRTLTSTHCPECGTNLDPSLLHLRSATEHAAP